VGLTKAQRKNSILTIEGIPRQNAFEEIHPVEKLFPKVVPELPLELATVPSGGFCDWLSDIHMAVSHSVTRCL
jgi:hypothetical protein